MPVTRQSAHGVLLVHESAIARHVPLGQSELVLHWKPARGPPMQPGAGPHRIGVEQSTLCGVVAGAGVCVTVTVGVVVIPAVVVREQTTSGTCPSIDKQNA
jgi:hypothetical protein